MPTLQEYLSAITPHNGEYVTVAIDGAAASGKSTFARKLFEKILCDYTRTNGDDYFDPYKPGDNQTLPGFFNAERFMSDAGILMRRGERELRYSPFNWELGCTTPGSLAVSSGVIHEGIKALELPIDWDVKVWVDTPRDVRQHRFIEERTDAERRATGASREELAARFNLWADDAADYELRVRHLADFVIDGQLEFEAQLQQLETEA